MPKILVIDDHPIVREGLKACIRAGMPGWSCAEASTAPEALSLASKHSFALIIMDLSLTGRGGLDFLTDLRHSYPQIPILVFSFHSEQDYAGRCLRAGANGYVTKGAETQELLKAIRMVLNGERYLSPAVAQMIALEKVFPTKAGPLSNREFQILESIAAGKTLTEIARELSLSVKTVSTHKRRIMAKLAVSNNAELIRRVLDDGVVESFTARKRRASQEAPDKSEDQDK